MVRLQMAGCCPLKILGWRRGVDELLLPVVLTAGGLQIEREMKEDLEGSEDTIEVQEEDMEAEAEAEAMFQDFDKSMKEAIRRSSVSVPAAPSGCSRCRSPPSCSHCTRCC